MRYNKPYKSKCREYNGVVNYLWERGLNQNDTFSLICDYDIDILDTDYEISKRYYKIICKLIQKDFRRFINYVNNNIGFYQKKIKEVKHIKTHSIQIVNLKGKPGLLFNEKLIAESKVEPMAKFLGFENYNEMHKHLGVGFKGSISMIISKSISK